ncbi:zinc finger, CCHC-type containing protein, partial [Tanacetum coccineum]
NLEEEVRWRRRWGGGGAVEEEGDGGGGAVEEEGGGGGGVYSVIIMAGNTVKEMTTNFRKLDKFEGHDFRWWQKKMHFLLTTLKVVYFLTTPMPQLLEDDTVKAIRRRAKWENDDYICRGHILNEDASSKKFLVSNFNNYKMVDSKPAMEQFNELLRILRQYTQHGLKMDEFVSVSSVIDKLPPSWKEFKHTLKHGKDDLSLVQFGSHLRIEESLKARESDKGKGKEVVGPSVNMTEEGGKNKNNKQNKGKKRGFKDNNGGSGSNKKPKLELLVVQERGLRISPKTKVDALAWWIDSGAITHVCKDRCWFKTYEPVEDGSVLYMGDDHFTPVYGKGSVVLEFSMDIAKILRKRSKTGQTQTRERKECKSQENAIKDRCWFKTYEPVEDGSILYMGDDHFAPVHGKESVVLELSSGKSITLFNVLYVSKLCKNLISGPVLNKCGYKQVYESDKYILSKSGVFVGFGYYNNGMFMLNLNKVPDDSGSVYMAVVRLPDPKRKTLGEKGIDCIFVGYAEHSKAYRFYIIELSDFVSINIIIESRDAIFNENHFSSIPRLKDIIPNSDESQRDDQSNDVPSETLKPQEDPITYSEATKSRDAAFWKEAIGDEILRESSFQNIRPRRFLRSGSHSNVGCKKSCQSSKYGSDLGQITRSQYAKRGVTGDSMERAATTAISLDAEQGSGAKIPYWGTDLLKLGLRDCLNRAKWLEETVVEYSDGTRMHSEDVVNRILQVILDLQHFKSSLLILASTILQISSAIRHISNIDNMYIKSYSFISHLLWSSQSFGHQKGACPWLTENHFNSQYIKHWASQSFGT